MAYNHVTNIERIREEARLFLHLEILPTSLDIVATHPFTSTWVTIIDDDNTAKTLDLRVRKNQALWRAKISKLINSSDLFGIMLLLNSPYRLVFLKYILNDISNSDLGQYLKDTWSAIECISTDVNVSSAELVKMFKRADKNTLMNEEERNRLNSLPAEVDVYRGVSPYNKHNKKALSWTTNYQTAKWFALRFDDAGEVWHMKIPKKFILACIDNRNEYEVILNLVHNNFAIDLETVKKTTIKNHL